MIDKLKIENFTVFNKAEFTFSTGLNVIIGENGTGKSHILKLAYSYLRCLFDTDGGLSFSRDHKSNRQPFFANEKLMRVFRTDSMANLLHEPNTTTSTITLERGKSSMALDLSEDGLLLKGLGPYPVHGAPVFIPAKEVLSFYRGFVSAYDLRELSFDETYNDLCLALGSSELREKHQEKVAVLIGELEKVIGGRILFEEGRAYLSLPSGKKMEVNLLAEGWRKIGMLAYLLRNGSIAPGKCLFWDEPEANLNPRLMVILAKVLVALARNGVQIFLASHSLFLVRELVIQSAELKNGGSGPRYFGLARKKGAAVVTQGDSIEEIEPLSFLDADLEQSGRYLDLDKR